MEDKWQELERRISQLEAEVRELKEQRGNVPKPAPQPFPPMRNPAVAAKKKEPIDWEYAIGRIWLPRIFLFVLLFGLIWGFNAAVDMGMITEPVRVLLGGLLASTLLYIGIRQMKSGRELLGFVLLGGSICVYLLSTFAAHSLYGFINGTFAFVLNFLWIVLALFLAHRYRSEGLAVLAATGGILVPLLVDINGDASWFFAAFEATIYGTFLGYSLYRSYRILYYTSAGLLHVALLALTATGGDSSVFALVALVQHLFLLGAYLLRKTRMSEQTGTLLSSFALTVAWISLSYEEWVAHLVLIGLIALYAALVFYLARTDKKEAAPPLLGLGSYALLILTLSMVEGDFTSILVVWEGIIALYIARAVTSLFQKITGLIVYGIGFLMSVYVLADGMKEVLSMNSLVWLSLLGSMFAFRWIEKRVAKLINIGIAIVLLLFLTDLTNGLTLEASENVQRLSLSFVWALYAAAIVVYGVVRRKKQVRGIGLAMIFAALLKVIFFDLPTVSIAVRAILFIGIGLIGILLSRLLYARTDNEGNEPVDKRGDE